MSPSFRLCLTKSLHPLCTNLAHQHSTIPNSTDGGQLCPAILNSAPEVRYESNLEHYRKADV
jgi:hypothetical protein